MRHPVYLGLRKDKKAEEVVKEISEKNQKEVQTDNNMNSAKEVLINNHTIKLTNLNKLYWPDEGFTKGDLIDYFRKVSGLYSSLFN